MSTPETAPVPESERFEGYRVAMVGATGAVGLKLLEVLEEREFPVKEIVLFASGRKPGMKIPFRGEEHTVRTMSAKNIRNFDLAFFMASADVAREWAPRFTADGCAVIDNSTAFRMHPDVPLVAAGVNDEDIDRYAELASDRRAHTREKARFLAHHLEQAGLEWRILENSLGQTVLQVQEREPDSDELTVLDQGLAT